MYTYIYIHVHIHTYIRVYMYIHVRICTYVHTCTCISLSQDVQTPLFLMEHSARVLVMAVQVMVGMWKRNGYSVFRQVVTYQYSYPREMMYDKDIVMVQVS